LLPYPSDKYLIGCREKRMNMKLKNKNRKRNVKMSEKPGNDVSVRGCFD
jgi:hypothetical protein